MTIKKAFLTQDKNGRNLRSSWLCRSFYVFHFFFLAFVLLKKKLCWKNSTRFAPGFKFIFTKGFFINTMS